MKTRIIAAGLFLLTAIGAQAYKIENVKWANGNVPFYLNLGQYNNVAAQSLAEWDQYTGNTHLTTTTNATTNGKVWFMDGRSTIGWSSDVGWDMPSNILGACSLYYIWNSAGTGFVMTESDITINTDFNWSSGTWDIGRVLLHEMGHAIGLDHSQYSSSIMAPYISWGDNRRKLTADDIAGAQFIYGQRTVPDNGTTVALLGMALAGLAICKRRKERPWIYEQ